MTERPSDQIAKAVAGYWNAGPYDAATNPGGMDEAVDGSVAGHVDSFPAAVRAVGLMTAWTGEQAAAAGAARDGLDDIVAAVSGDAAAAQTAATAATAAAASVQRGEPGGVAALDEAGKVPAAQAPANMLAQGKHTIWIPAAAMTARTTAGASAGTAETTTNKVMRKSLDFDTATQEHAQFAVAMPKSWNEGAVTFQALWTATGGSGGVAWSLQAMAAGDGDALDAAFGTAQTVTDTLISAGALHQTAEGAAVTVAGPPAESDMVIFQIYRAVANAADTLAQDALLLGVRLFYTINAGSDA